MIRSLLGSFLYFPERAILQTPAEVGLEHEELAVDTADGERLHGWWISAQEPSLGHILLAHGNAGNVGDRVLHAELLRAAGFDVLLFDYRGYGRSEGDVAGERGLYADADAAYDFLTKERGVAPRDLVLYGQSLGTAAAVDLASRRECRALVVESGLSSAADMAGEIVPWLPRFVRGLTKNKLDSASKVARVVCPVLVVHGGRDEVIPTGQGLRLYEAAREPKRLKIVEGAGHNDLSMVGGGEYFDSLAEFARSGR